MAPYLNLFTAERSGLFRNRGDGTFEEMTELAGVGGAEDLWSSSAAFVDYDRDGDLDLLITQNGRRPALLRNDQQTGHHWLRLELVGQPPNTGAIGARVNWTVNGITHEHAVQPTRGYLSQVELPVTIGLGTADEPAAISIQITWPDGSEQTLQPDRLDTTLRIAQPETPT